MAADIFADYDHAYKILLIGDTGCGKTHLLSRYINDTLPEVPAQTILAEFATTIITLANDVRVKVYIVDVGGSEKYHRAGALTEYRGAVGAMIVYDVTQRSTFENCRVWMEELKETERYLDLEKEELKEKLMVDPDLLIMLVGNKMDVVEKDPSARQVSVSEAQNFANEFDMLFAEASSVTRYNVREIFENLVQEILFVREAYTETHSIRPSVVVTLHKDNNDLLRFMNVGGEEILCLPFDCKKNPSDEIWAALAKALDRPRKRIKLVTPEGTILQGNSQIADFLGCQKQGSGSEVSCLCGLWSMWCTRRTKSVDHIDALSAK